MSEDTIAALATPPGRGAIAIVRLSGPSAARIAGHMTGVEPVPRRAELCVFRDPQGERIDQGLLLYFPGPRSYTGEDVVELHAHGGAIVSDWLLESVCALGARPARAGEFTLRAFLNDKLDLTQAEAVADLIDSGSRLAAQAAARSLVGAFSRRVTALQTGLTALRVELEAQLDFSDQEIEPDATEALAARLSTLTTSLALLQREAGQGSTLRDGMTVVIAGAPNVGKSSLLNQLAGYDAAIVTAIPGTTRDPLREHLALEGLPLSLIDTAGLRASADTIESEGVRRARHALAQADRVLWVTDVRGPLAQVLAEARTELGAETPYTVVQNKLDLLAETPASFEYEGTPVVRLSALTGAGMDLLRAHLRCAAKLGGEADGTFSARRRHLDALARAAAHLTAAQAELDSSALELAAERLRGAQTALSELTGELTSDELLGEIFASFCIGK